LKICCKSFGYNKKYHELSFGVDLWVLLTSLELEQRFKMIKIDDKKKSMLKSFDKWFSIDYKKYVYCVLLDCVVYFVILSFQQRKLLH
jgi:hypothetical protein